MRQFKKKTLALVLASVLTVVGAFGAESFKNSLMSLEFKSDSNDSVNVNLYTKKSDTTPVSQKKIDANTYVLILPETDGKNASSPELTSSIESVNIKTMPYTTNGKGYTKITIKTADNVNLTPSKALFVPQKETNELPVKTSQNPPQNELPQMTSESSMPETVTTTKKEQKQKQVNSTKYTNTATQTFNDSPDINKSVKQFEKSEQSAPNTTSNTTSATRNNENESSSEVLLIILGAILVITVSTYIYMKSKDKMAEILGEKGDFSLDTENSDNKDKKDSKRKKIKKTIQKLDKMYENPVEMPLKFAETAEMPDINEVHSDNETNSEQKEDSVIVDLDEIFQGKNSEDDENSALDDFLNDFNFNTESEELIEQEADNIIDTLFKKYIQGGTITFSEADIAKINELLNSEISDDTLKNIELYAPKTPKIVSHQEVLENLITNYTVNQNLSFSRDDVEALDKLTQVEIDSDFVDNLSTNPKRTEEMAKEIRAKKPLHKSREIITLKVKDSLPDLSEALKKQAGKRIESEVKPEVVYFSEGYEVSKLNVNDEDLPDLTLDFDDPEYNKYRPSDKIEYAQEGYEVETLSIKDELPDLHDAAEHPEKYEEKKETVKIDEDSLLKNIENVSFKPFYDGNENIEISNNFDNEPISIEPELDEFLESISDDTNESEVTPEIASQEASSEILPEIPVETPAVSTETPHEKIAKQIASKEQQKASEDLMLILSDGDKQAAETQNYKNKPLPKLQTHRYKHKKSVFADANAAKLLKIIETQKEERKQKKQEAIVQKREKSKPKNLSNEPVKLQYKTCIIEGEEYEIVSSSEISTNIGCYLAKQNDGYSILGYIGDKVFKIKFYEKLDSQRIQSRFNEKLGEDTSQYIVRIGRHKFILNVSDSKMEYVMDLC